MTQPRDVHVLGQKLSDIADDDVRLACSLSDRMPTLIGVQAAITSVLGRKRRHLVRALFVGFLLTGAQDRTAVLRRVHEMLHYRISDWGRAELGIPTYARDRRGSDAGYRALVMADQREQDEWAERETGVARDREPEPEGVA